MRSPFRARTQGLIPVLVAALAGALTGAPAQAAPITYQLDPAHTFAQFEVRHFGTSTLRGRLGPITGEATLDRAAATGDVRLALPIDTIDTGVPLLDRRLLGREMFAAEAEPLGWFIATRFRFDAQGGVRDLRGEFILKGHSEPLTLTARHFACRDDARLQREVCGGDFEGDIKRSDFGISFGLPFVADDVHLVVQVEGIGPPR